MLDKLKGTFIGLAVGDALGAPHEFKYHKKNEYTGYIYIDYELKSRWHDSKVLPAGQVTDDTEMTLTLLNSILKKGGYDRTDVILSYEKWANSTSMIGKNTYALFKNVKTLKGYENHYKKLFTDVSEDQWTKSNGSLMRCTPLAFLYDQKIAIEDCKLTNPHPLNIEASFLYVHAIRLLVLGYDNFNVFKYIKENSQIEEIKQVFNDIENKKIRDVTGKTKGYVLNAFFCAFWVLLYYDNYSEAIDFIIKLGGDTDTNAAISGALMGAKLGFDKLTKEEKTKFNIDKVLNVDLEKSDIKRSEEYVLGPLEKFTLKMEEFFNRIALPNLNKFLKDFSQR